MKTHTTDLLRLVNSKFTLVKSSKSRSGYRLRNDDTYKSYMAGLNKQLKKDVSTKDQAMCLVVPNDRQDIDAKIKMALDAPQGRWYENDKQVKVLMIVFDPELENKTDTRMTASDFVCDDIGWAIEEFWTMVTRDG